MFFLLLSLATARADVNSDYTTQYQKLQDNLAEQQKLKQQIKELQSQGRTLINQISYLDNQTHLTELQISATLASISQTEEQLTAVGQDIASLTEKLGNLDTSINDLANVFNARIRASYQESFLTPFQVFLTATDFSSAVLRVNYLKSLQAEDKKVLQQMKNVKGLYLSQKTELGRLKQEKEKLKNDLESQKTLLQNQQASLGLQKQNKNKLLQVTQNDENKYQQLLIQIRAEIESMAKALKGGVKIGEVKKGDIIAHEGNSGCVLPVPSSADPLAGSHLHFGVYKDGMAVNPKPYLDRGDFSWPENSTTVTQSFGENYDLYMREFGIPGHNGLDMSLGYGAPIYAAADGTAYETGDSYQLAAWCNGLAHAIRIEHPNGLVTIYWHIL